MSPCTTERAHSEFSPHLCQPGLQHERKQQKNHKDYREESPQTPGVWSCPVELPLVSSSDKTEGISPIPPHRAGRWQTVYHVNTAEIRPGSSLGVSSDPEQKHLFSTSLCLQASESKANLPWPCFSFSLTLPPSEEIQGGGRTNTAGGTNAPEMEQEDPSQGDPSTEVLAEDLSYKLLTSPAPRYGNPTKV